ncbi:MAG: hypothetical protein ACREMF_07845 [Gemmatimonadales bacterium]
MRHRHAASPWRVAALLSWACISTASAQRVSVGGPGGGDADGVQVDSARRLVVITAGPFHVPVAPPMTGHAYMHMRGDDSLVKQFAWPLTTHIQSLRLALVDGSGRPLPRRLLHHLNLVNFNRRQLVYPMVERLMGFGQETEDVSIPRSIGLPLTAGQRIGLFVMWDNETDRALDDVYVRLTFKWAPANLRPRPLSVMPFIIDANIVVAGHNTFDVPPGGYTKSYDFELPVSGHVVAAGGHLHDHGIWVRLVDRTTGRALVTVKAKRDSAGRVFGMTRELLALRGRGPRLRAGHPYRLEARYDNPTPDTLVGMMGMMVGLFEPEDLRDWPAIDPNDRDYLKDLTDILPGGLFSAGDKGSRHGRHH